MLEVTAPGKIVFSGEWSVLEDGNPAIVFALDKKTRIQIIKGKEIKLNAPEFGINNVTAFFREKKLWTEELNAEQKKAIVFLEKSTETALNYLHEKKVRIKKFTITADSSQMQKESTKVGFGSSAALCAAVVFGITKFHGVALSKMQAFKLATIAHFFAQGKIGSGFDVAASVFGEAMMYKRFRTGFLEKQSKKSITKTVQKDWPGLRIKKITFPKNLKFLVVFSGKKADTREIVEKMSKYRKKKPQEHAKAISEIRKITQEMLKAFSRNNEKKIIELVKENRKKLKELGEKSSTGLETEELKEIIETSEKLGLAAKFCGAGGGDSAIVVSFDQKKIKAAAKALNQKGFTTINTGISFDGVKQNA